MTPRSWGRGLWLPALLAVSVGQAAELPGSEAGWRPAPQQPPANVAFQTPGVRDNLPAFRDRLADRLRFELSWTGGKYDDFDAWRQQARAKVRACLLAPPPAAHFDPAVVAEQDRGEFVARKVVFNLTG